MGAKVDPDDLIVAAEVQAVLRLFHPDGVTADLKRYLDLPQAVFYPGDSRGRLWRHHDIIRGNDVGEVS